ncbi:MAG: hypothetical protein IKW39_01490 [Alphaproteobacteria bacterium]|nr:hypothetical protein [Alphaproteobacteria bacterium]
MRKGTTAKKIVAIITICCGLLGPHTAKAFIWPCVDLTQIASFISSITNGLSTISNAITQVENMEKTIAAVGSQISSMRDFMSDLRKTIASIKEAVESVTASVKQAISDINETIKMVENIAKESIKALEDVADSYLKNVEEIVENNGSEEDAQTALDGAKEESETIKNQVIETYDEALNNINTTLNDANSTVDMLVDAVNTNPNLTDDKKEELNKRADEIKQGVDTLKETANNVLNEAKDKYNEEYAQKVAKAYDDYSKAISDYFAGKISKEELSQKGKIFKDSISSMDVSIDSGLIDQFMKQADDIVDQIEKFEEDILDTFSNDKEYSDEDDTEETEPKLSQNENNVRFSFSYNMTTDIVLAKSLYSTKAKGKPFLISKEFMCKGKTEDDIEKLKDNSGWFRTCVSRAKTELEFYPDAPNDSLYKKYQRNGVYNHISHDYSAANLVNISKMKQFSESWRGTVGKAEDSEYYKLKEMISKGDVDNQASGISALSSIELWTPRLWSNIKRVDAIGRAKDMVKQFEYEVTLYIDNVNGRNQDVADAINDKRGVYDDKKVFPNVMLSQSHCNLHAEDVTMDSTESEKNVQKQKEENIKKCIYKYALGAGKGTTEESAMEGDIEEGKKIWREKQKMVANDAAFENLTISVINNYETTKDYKPVSELKDNELNIVKLQEVIKGAGTSREYYGAGAQVNYYATQQLLNIVDADAVDLQAKILKDLPIIDFSYFPKE